MLSRNYDPSLAAGTICATGTLGQIIPPSIALVILGDVLSAAYQQSQLNIGNFSARTVSVGDLFMGALVPGLMLVFCYALSKVPVKTPPAANISAVPASEKATGNPANRTKQITPNINRGINSTMLDN